MSVEERLALFESFGSKFFSVKWKKSDGSVREASVQCMQHKMFTEGHASKAKANTSAGDKSMFTCVDTTNNKWIKINLNNLIQVKAQGKEYVFSD